MPNLNQIYVTQPFLPPLEEFIPYLEKIWENKVLTNNGPFHRELEAALCDYLGVKYISLFANGTVALVTALQALRISGEVITTPYSFVATAHSLLWNNIKPVFVDIDPHTCNIDPQKIEESITPQTTAILAVHCYGTPCAINQIQQVADTYGLRLIYDAAHAFGVKFHGNSILNHGDLSVLSFHATKVFNTFEGGAIVCNDEKTKTRIDYLKNFGFANETTVTATGINGKMSEVNSAFGLLQLKYVDTVIARRRSIEQNYRARLANTKGVSMLQQIDQCEGNSSYFPIFIGDDFSMSRDDLYHYMKSKGVHGRRYFYPLISDMPMYRGLRSANVENLKIAKTVADSVICLPIYPSLTNDEVENITDMINGLGSEK